MLLLPNNSFLLIINLTNAKIFIILYASIRIYAYGHIMEKQLRKYTDIFKALEDPTRLRIINLLLNSSEPLCVVEIVESIDTPQYKVSKHLAILKNSGLIDYTRDGTWIY
jgi:predicted transcriptional regulator